MKSPDEIGLQFDEIELRGARGNCPMKSPDEIGLQFDEIELQGGLRLA